MIYVFENIDLITDEFVEGFLPNLPLDRQNKALNYKHKIGRNLCVMGYWLLCFGLRREYNIFTYPQLSYNKNGKPYLPEHPDIHFNISHCKNGVACVVSKNEVGIDIQDIRDYKPAVAKRVCSDDEMEILAQSPHPEKDFCKFWTIKEAFIKLSGTSADVLENKTSSEFINKQFDGRILTHWGEGYFLCSLGDEQSLVFISEIDQSIED